MTRAAILLASLAAWVVAVPALLVAQESGRVYRIGHVGASTPQDAAPFRQALEGGLRDLGYVEARNVAFEYRDLAGRYERFEDLYRELVRARVDVIVAGSNVAIAAAKRATSTVPVVMVAASDPVGSGFVASLARPGGNITGLSADVSPEVAAKRLQLLKEVAPAIRRVAVLWDPMDGEAQGYMRAAAAAATKLGVTLHSVGARTPADLDGALAAIAQAQPDGLFVFLNLLTFVQRQPIVDFAARQRLPAVYGNRTHVEVGGLLAYGVDLLDLFRRGAGFVDRILKGARPGDLPIEQPTKFELVVHLRTARALGLTLPPAVLLQVDEVFR